MKSLSITKGTASFCLTDSEIASSFGSPSMRSVKFPPLSAEGEAHLCDLLLSAILCRHVLLAGPETQLQLRERPLSVRTCVLVSSTADRCPICRIAHSLILSHAMAVDLYRREYKARQGGVIGVTLVRIGNIWSAFARLIRYPRASRTATGASPLTIPKRPNGVPHDD